MSSVRPGPWGRKESDTTERLNTHTHTPPKCTLLDQWKHCRKRETAVISIRPVSYQISHWQGTGHMSHTHPPPPPRFSGRSWQCDFSPGCSLLKSCTSSSSWPEHSYSETTAWGKRKEGSQGEWLWCYLNISAPVLISSRPPSSLCCWDCSLNTLAQKSGILKSERPLKRTQAGKEI